MSQRFNYPKNPLSEKSGLTLDFMEENGAVYWREIGDSVHMVYDFGYNGRLCMDCSKTGYESFYCFSSVDLTVKALDDYANALEANPDADVEPEGWHRHSSTGRRRTNGDKTTEYINF